MERQVKLNFLGVIQFIKLIQNMNYSGFSEEDNDLEMEPQSAYKSQNSGKMMGK